MTKKHRKSMRERLSGSCKVTCGSGDILRLLNICSHHDIHTWQCASESAEAFHIHMSDRKELRDLTGRCGIDIEIKETQGILGFLKKNRRRASVPVGIFIFAVLIYIQSLYVWHIEITGNEGYTSEELLNMLELEYPCYGQRKKDIDYKALRDMLMDNFEDICWASCSVSGTKLTINVKESVDVFTDYDMDEPCSIAASMDCTIYSIVTASGTPVVVSGDDVKKGDVLISGAVNICNDASEVVDTRYVTAQGEIYGMANLAYIDEIERNHYVKNVTKERLTGIEVGIAGAVFSPYRSDAGEDADITREYHRLHIGDFYLPLFYVTESASIYEVETLVYTDDELSELADEHLLAYITKLQEKGVQIRQKNVIITDGHDGIMVSGDISVILPVGVPTEIEVGALEGGDGSDIQ